MSFFARFVDFVLSSSPDVVKTPPTAPNTSHLMISPTTSSLDHGQKCQIMDNKKNKISWPKMPNGAIVDRNVPSAAVPATMINPSKISKKYRQLKRQSINKGTLFIDNEFPPDNTSLFMAVENGDESAERAAEIEIEWKRPGEIVEDPKLFVEGASPCDVTQGILGNCWFVSACSALTHNGALLQKVIPEAARQEWVRGNTYCGIFQFCFWRFGRWVEVIVDDLLPTKNGQLLFARSKTPNEFWSALLEKAFAKLYGCYETLVGGQLADALIELSGGVAETLNIRKFLDLHQQQTQQHMFSASLFNTSGVTVHGNGTVANLPNTVAEESNGVDRARRLFRLLKYAFEREALIVAAIAAANKEQIELSLDCGLVMGHAYAVTAIRYIDLDAMANIWDEDDGAQMGGTGVRKWRQIRRKKQAMVRLQNPWGMKEWNGPWSDGSPEWEQVTEEQKFRLGITVEEDGEFWMPWHEFVRYFTDICVCQLLTMGTLTECTQHQQQQAQRGVSMRRKQLLSMQLSTATVGLTEKRWREWSFFGRWSSNGAKSGAPKNRAGGSALFPATFCYNPQFTFEVNERDGPAEVMLALCQREEGCAFDGAAKNGKRLEKMGKRQREPLVVIGMHLMRVEQNRKHRIHQAIGPVLTSEYQSVRSVHLHIDGLSPGRYIVLPTTYAPREEADFMLRIYSPSKLNPAELRDDFVTPSALRLLRCHHQFVVARVRIVEIQLQKMIHFGECDLFCVLSTSQGGDRTRTILAKFVPGQPVKFNALFVFHAIGSRQWLLNLALFELRKPSQRHNCLLGIGKVALISNNETVEIEMELISQMEKRKSLIGEGKGRETVLETMGKARLEISAYDDPFYI